MKKIIAFIVCVLILAGCQPIPESVKDNNYQLEPISEIFRDNGKVVNTNINNILFIDAEVKVPNKKTIDSFEMAPMDYDIDKLCAAFEIDKEESIITQGSLNSNPYDSNYIPLTLSNDNYFLYQDKKMGQYYYSVNQLKTDVITDENIITLASANLNLQLAKDMISSVMGALDLDYDIDAVNAYRSEEEDYYYFTLSQIIDGVKLDNDNNPLANDTLADSHYIKFLVDEQGIVLFDATLCMKKQKVESYTDIISVDTALGIIKDKIDLIISPNSNYITEDGKVTINSIELIYIPFIESNDKQCVLKPIWSFKSGQNIGTNRYCNVKIDATTGSLL